MMMARQSEHPVHPQFVDRWSPRALTGEAIDEGTLFSILEAARWAPSAFNAQPWQFVYARRDTAAWEGFLDALLPFNQAWAKQAGALIFIVSDPTPLKPGTSETMDCTSHSFDTGAAWLSLALQANALGWHSHAMLGFDDAKARALIGAAPRLRIEAAVALGRQAPPDALPENLRARELPSARKPLSQIAFEGALPPHHENPA
jgi:nitroreductase